VKGERINIDDYKYINGSKMKFSKSNIWSYFLKNLENKIAE
jgi:hypothetical protein